MNAGESFCSRRSFIGLASTAMIGCTTGKGSSGFDPDFAVFISDPHLNADPKISRYLYPREWLAKTVSEVIAMRPMPQHVFFFGDLVFDHGVEHDYEVAREVLKPLYDAGIKVVHCMGNHDRRLNFAKHFPEAAAQTVVPGRIVMVTHLRHCDFIMLDSLKGDNDGNPKGPVEGELNAAECEWLKANMPGWSRPVFLGAHHGIDNLMVGNVTLKEFLGACPNFAGWIHGHDHKWLPNWTTAWKSGRRTIRTLTLPSNGLWGDIGYVLFHMNPAGAEAEFVQKDFWNHVPGLPSSELRHAILQGRNGQKCSFVFNRKTA